jgi:NDP-sugar pyrophosphorylase family protein
MKVGFYKINFFSQWGTPEDFNEYKNWSEKFLKIQKFKKKKLKGILVIPAAGKGQRFIKEGYKTHKPLIEVSGKPMIVQSMLTHPKHHCSQVIISKKNNSSKSLKKKIKKYFPKIKIFSLNKHTNGQAITCFETLKKENKEIPVTIGSCDTGLIFNEKKFLNLYNKLDTDVIVWATKNHSESIRNPKQFGWIKTKNKENIDYVSVKKPLKKIEGSPIILGTFTFKKIEYFINSVNKMIKRKALVNNEFYIDTSINDAIKLGYNCKIFLVDDYLPWGTPNELKTFKYWQKYFNLWKNHPYKINNPI